MEDIEKKRKDSLRYSIFDGAFYSIMVGLGESFFSAYAVFLKATNLEIGLLGSLPRAVSSLSQLWAHKAYSIFNSRKKFVLIGSILQTLVFIPVILVYFFGTFRVLHLIFFVSLYWVLALIVNPAWSSWMGDLVHEKERGEYFGKRNWIGGFASFLAFLLGGYLLQHFKTDVNEYLGFAVIFILAMIARAISVVFLEKKYEPEYHPSPSSYFSFGAFLKQSRFNNFGLFVLYVGFVNLTTNIAAPFFAPYMLNDLSMSYAQFTLIIAAAMVTKYLAMPIWGKAADKFGAMKVLSLSGFLMPIVPFLWLFSHNMIYLLGIQLFSGFVWAAFELASFKFVYDTTTVEKRALCVAYYNAITGIAIFIGALMGALIVRYNDLFWTPFYMVFLVSFVTRLAASIIFLPKLREVLPVEQITEQKLLFTVIGSMPTQGVVHSLIAIRKKVEHHNPLHLHLHLPKKK